jgi:hypothetical protein
MVMSCRLFAPPKVLLIEEAARSPTFGPAKGGLSSIAIPTELERQGSERSDLSESQTSAELPVEDQVPPLGLSDSLSAASSAAHCAHMTTRAATRRICTQQQARTCVAERGRLCNSLWNFKREIPHARAALFVDEMSKRVSIHGRPDPFFECSNEPR